LLPYRARGGGKISSKVEKILRLYIFFAKVKLRREFFNLQEKNEFAVKNNENVEKLYRFNGLSYTLKTLYPIDRSRQDASIGR
jgi:hypothetical protein